MNSPLCGLDGHIDRGACAKIFRAEKIKEKVAAMYVINTNVF
jgi:hypothetical protein